MMRMRRRKNFSAVLQTYVFWTVFWLFACICFGQNLATFLLAIAPPVVGVFSIFFYWKFVCLPASVALTGTCLVWRHFFRKGAVQAGNAFGPLICNATFLIFFVIGSEIQLAQLIRVQANALQPDCMRRTSFTRSFLQLDAAPAHTVLFKDGRVYQWSFKESAFYLNRNRQGERCVQGLDL